MRRILLCLALLALTALAAAEPRLGPEQRVAERLERLSGLVAACRLPLAVDPAAVRGIIDQELRPYADVLYAGQLVLGRHWPQASPEQRRRFAEALYGALVNRHATGLLLLTPHNVRVAKGDGPRGGETAQVELSIDAGLSRRVPVLLELRRHDDRWRIYDARWEGQSFVLGLRHTYAEEIGRRGLETVIRELETRAGTPPGPPAQRNTPAGRCLQARESL
ncbi:phospholipid-binding protein MlaC [Thioalkalivibrio sp. XN279]|uniref:MlaC/ttg2D family ABC transporter substrate-binding protein n=1 Tax=Thioalkalivibrio sp. XN279 TaxID=2714953 RepID=UPI00140B34AA|nr:ABC transporter substrate-binding protein [Thioalkalivibrio sp. XN279]NHA14474.1 ABC transporter substrate-binding protein [Thioalkalivibrio sp. XN279]